MTELEPLHVLIRFGKAIPVESHGPAMLAFEKHLRQLSGARAEVFKEQQGDDSRLRALMTPQQRAKL